MDKLKQEMLAATTEQMQKEDDAARGNMTAVREGKAGIVDMLLRSSYNFV